MDFDELKEEYLKCCKCQELCKNRTQVIFGSGDDRAEILFIGEAPGANEDKEGVPFCGMSGKILDELLDSAGLSRGGIFITNTILCRPPGNRDPTAREVDNCRERLDLLIGIMKPKVIVTIGNFATERIINKKGVRSLRGKIFHTVVDKMRIKVIPVIHPASYLYSGRNPDMLREMKNDFSMIRKAAAEDIGQKDLSLF